MTMIDFILLVACSLLALPILVVAVETIAASLGRATVSASGQARPPIAVLIPAHNEEGGITATIRSVLPQLVPHDRLLVVADNCTDLTAAVARAAGAEVIIRQDESRRGKGFALAAGIDFLRVAPPAIVIIVDADMQLAVGSVAALSQSVLDRGRPVQSVNLLEPERAGGAKSQVSAFAFAFKNLVRARGASMLGIPCLLKGTGMAFPWKIIRQAKLATGHIVEDMQLSIDLAITGHTPDFCSAARVTGALPATDSAATTQRTRWEHGHLQTILHNCPRLMYQGMRQLRPSLLALALDLAVPPLAFLAFLWLSLTCLTVLGFITGFSSWIPLGVALNMGLVFLGSIILAWSKFARQILPFAALLSIPLYIAWKIPLYLAFVFQRQKTWVRTART